jgi:hypothetical protein
MVTIPVGLGAKSHCAGEGHQQFTGLDITTRTTNRLLDILTVIKRLLQKQWGGYYVTVSVKNFNASQ